MKVASPSWQRTTVAARIAGEDICCGDYVTVLNEQLELPSYLWSCSATSLPPDELVRIRYMPQEAGHPLKVIGVCLPFVYAKNDRAAVVTIDTRRQQLVRLDRKCARNVWKQLSKKVAKKKR
ncbi:hypothetical protein EC9_25670 [Rosistilla ulvae]|uniref:Uncharacterized protein n=1 Tax=Rosistilla ulvae TaxID=1930277 RepID=A0A517M0H7_9BACT|nr:hypothetical protein [Rosistilla ulvae]QDS88377.1 hypothetical protein EC9_25670 [Rosistilla ulvae]